MCTTVSYFLPRGSSSFSYTGLFLLFRKKNWGGGHGPPRPLPLLRHCLWNITHPGFSYELLAPLYFMSAIMIRGLQLELNSLQSIAILGIIHGAAEVIERSTIVVTDHVCPSLRTRKASPWGSFRTPRRERLVADVAIMSMLYESTAIVFVNGSLYMYQLIFLETTSVTNKIKEFALSTSVMLVIEWFFTSVSLAIETRYQNMAVIAVWRCQRKRHTPASSNLECSVYRETFFRG